MQVPCGHSFCGDCLSGWFKSRQGQPTCPTCRSPLPPRARGAHPEGQAPPVSMCSAALLGCCLARRTFFCTTLGFRSQQ